MCSPDTKSQRERSISEHIRAIESALLLILLNFASALPVGFRREDDCCASDDADDDDERKVAVGVANSLQCKCGRTELPGDRLLSTRRVDVDAHLTGPSATEAGAHDSSKQASLCAFAAAAAAEAVCFAPTLSANSVGLVVRNTASPREVACKLQCGLGRPTWTCEQARGAERDNWPTFGRNGPDEFVAASRASKAELSLSLSL